MNLNVKERIELKKILAENPTATVYYGGNTPIQRKLFFQEENFTPFILHNKEKIELKNSLYTDYTKEIRVSEKLFHKRTSSGWISVISKLEKVERRKIDKPKREVDALYYHLWFAQHYSNVAKMNYGFNKDKVNILYYEKDRYIKRALKRALKINVPVIFDPKESAIYFELDKGQVSFHVMWDEKDYESMKIKIEDNYKWSKLKNSEDIINSYFTNETMPKQQLKHIPDYYKEQGGEIPAKKPCPCGLIYPDKMQQGGLLNGPRHTEGGILAINHANDKLLELEGGEFIVCRAALDDDTEITLTGSPIQIVSQLNKRKGCKGATHIFAINEDDTMEQGGSITADDAFAYTMHEWKQGKLTDATGNKIAYPDSQQQAVAIAFAKAREVDETYGMKAQGGPLSEIRILQTSRKGAMLITDGEKTAWIMPRMQRPDGTFTDGAFKALKESTKTLQEKADADAAKEIPYCEVVRETDKAILVKIRLFIADGLPVKDAEIWFPKSKAQAKDGKLTVDGEFWNTKRNEITQKERYFIFTRFNEYDSSYGVDVVTEENITDQERRGKIFIPKSVGVLSNGKLIAPSWIVEKRLEEKADEYRTGGYSNTSSIKTYLNEREEVYPEIIPCNAEKPEPQPEPEVIAEEPEPVAEALEATEANQFIADACFKANPSKILGEQVIASGRWGDRIEVKGNADALSKIVTSHVVTRYYNPELSQSLATQTQAEIIKEVFESEKKEAIEKQVVSQKSKVKSQKSKVETQKTERLTASDSRLTTSEQTDYWTFRETLSRYNSSITPDELEAYLWTNPYLPHEKYIDKFMLTELDMVEGGLIYYINGRFEYRYTYASGNINKKMAQLTNRDKAHIIDRYGEEVYDRQVEVLRNAQPRKKTIGAATADAEKIVILPHSELAQTFAVKEIMGMPNQFRDAYPLATVFKDYLRKVLQRSDFKKSNAEEIIKYYLDNKTKAVSTRLTKEEKAQEEKLSISIKQRTKEEGDELFEKFLVEQLTPEDKLRLEYLWNEKYNGLCPVNLDKIPVAFTFGKYFKQGITLELSKTQRDGIAFINEKRSGILAYDVGVGKTLTAIAAISWAVENNLSNYPLIVVPNNVYDKWIGEIQGYYDKGKEQKMAGALPHFPAMRSLYNLNTDLVYTTLKDYSTEDHKTLSAVIKAIAEIGELRKTAPTQLPDALLADTNPHAETLRNIWNAAQQKFEAKDQVEKTLEGYGRFLRAQYEFYVFSLGTMKPMPKGTISIITYEGLRKLGMSNFTDTVQHLYTILSQGDKYEDPREAAILYEKLTERVASITGNAKLNIEDLQIDYLCVDEAHKAKKIFTSVKGSPKTDYEGEVRTVTRGNTKTIDREKSHYDLDSGQPSALGLTTYILATHIQQHNFNRNVVLLSATPFENNPLEVFSMLSLCNHKELVDNGFDGLKDFFDTFMKVQWDIKLTPTNDVVKDVILTGFNNLPQLRMLIRNVIDYKTGEEAEVSRPVKVVLPSNERGISTSFEMNYEQKQFMLDVESYINGDNTLAEICSLALAEEMAEHEAAEKELVEAMDEEERAEYLRQKKSGLTLNVAELNDSEQLGVRIMQGLSMMRQVALSPYLYKCKKAANITPTYEQYIETSPKLSYIMHCIKSVRDYHQANGSKQSGQVIYMNAGVNYFGLIKEYLVKKIGYTEAQVVIISGGMSKSAKERIKQEFLSGEALVLIGSKAIEVGVDLQNNASVLYNAYYDWNPTDAKQVEGRICRQGNRFANVRIVYPMVHNSSDPIMFQYLAEKTARLKEIWDMEGVKSQLDLRDFDPDTLKQQLITDPVKRAKMEIIRDKDKLDGEKIYLENQKDDLAKVAPAINHFNSTKPKAINTLLEFFNKKQTVDLRAIQTERPRKINEIEVKYAGKPEMAEKRKAAQEKFRQAEEQLAADHAELTTYLTGYTPESPEAERQFDLFVYRKAGEFIKWLEEPTGLNEPELEPYRYSRSQLNRELIEFRGAYKLYYDLKKKLLDPLGISFEEVATLKDEFDNKIQAITDQITTIEDSFNSRVERIRGEMAAQSHNVKMPQQAAEDFASLNYLLDDFYTREAVAVATVAKQPTKDDYDKLIKGFELARKYATGPEALNYKQLINGFKLAAKYL